MSCQVRGQPVTFPESSPLTDRAQKHSMVQPEITMNSINHIQHYIGGRFVSDVSGRSAPVTDPATGEITAHVALAGRAEVDAAVRAAADAFPAWSATTPLRRARVMFTFRELLQRETDRLAALITSEHGKVFSDARGEIIRGLEVVEFACGIPQLLKGEVTENTGTAIDSLSMRQPLGVCVGISPFNFPAMVPLWMIPVAIACGNTFVMKPSEKDPSLVNEIALLLAEAGLPAGVFNIIHGERDAVEALIDHPDVEAVSFVGSTPVAQSIHARASALGKRVQALGGAKNHAIVMPDADMEQTANALMGAAYGSAGERCMAISVAVPVGKHTAAKLIESLVPKVRALRIGPGTDPDAEMGPLVTRAHRDKVASYIDAGVDEGAELLVDGRGFALQGYEGGHFLGGTVFDHVTPAMRIYREEIFGPVLSIVRATDFVDALRLVNDHEFGNGAVIFTKDGETARTFSTTVKAGMIGVNVPVPVPMAFHSFGGWKRSIFGDHYMHGPEGVRFYTRLKTVTSRWPSGGKSAAEFVMPTMT